MTKTLYHPDLIDSDSLDGKPGKMEAVVEINQAMLFDVYVERNQCVALIARMALSLGLSAGIGKDTDPEQREDFRNVIYIELPAGQVSWHIHDSDLQYFMFLGMHEKGWDGHDSVTKYERVGQPSLERAPLGDWIAKQESSEMMVRELRASVSFWQQGVNVIEAAVKTIKIGPNHD